MKLALGKIAITIVLLLCIFVSAFAAEPTITIDVPSKGIVKTYTRHDLLGKANKESLDMRDTPVYIGQDMHYIVVPVAVLFEQMDIKDDALIQFKTQDGFSAPVNTKNLLNRDPKGAIAYIAIEDENNKWPTLKNKKGETAGPFYLIWKNPQLSDVREEEWPYQLSGFQVKSTLKEIYPNIFPDPSLAKTSGVNKGFKIFTQNCFACHTMNKQGESQIGPDLNVPHSPTEYFKEPYLRMLIRDPQHLRFWPQGKMRGFSEKVLSNKELDDLISYLKHMSQHKAVYE